jgi:hypothetical protein
VRKIIIEIARYHTQSTDCVGVILASKRQQRLQPANAGALVL